MAARCACNSAPRRSASMEAMVSASVACSISLSPTVPPFPVSFARYTSAIPPRPSLRTISYLPILRLAGAIMVWPLWGRLVGVPSGSGGLATRLWPSANGPAPVANRRAGYHPAPQQMQPPSLLGLPRLPGLACRRTVRPHRRTHRRQEEVERLDRVRGGRFQHVAVEYVAQQRWFGAVARGHSRAFIRLDQIVREPRCPRPEDEH